MSALRYGLIGTGLMGLEHQRNLNAIANVEVVAAADPEPTSLQWAQLQDPTHQLRTYSDYRELLRADVCDVYVISSPNFTHRSVLDDVLQSGAHVLIEKPLCTTIDDAAHIRRRAESYSGILWVGLEYRYMPPVSRAIQIAHSGQLGAIKMVAIREHRHPFLTKVQDWNRFNVNTGGTLVEKCCHFFDLMRLIAQCEPLRVTGFGAQSVNHLDERYDGRTPDILDNAYVIVEFGNGVRASLDLCMFAEGSLNNEEVSIVGDQGKVEAFLPSGELRLGSRSTWSQGVQVEISRDERVLVEGFHYGASFLEHLDFIDAVTNNSSPKVNATDGFWSVVLGVAAQIAIDEHRVVEIAELVDNL